jgi:hypothetical protein
MQAPRYIAKGLHAIQQRPQQIGNGVDQGLITGGGFRFIGHGNSIQ